MVVEISPSNGGGMYCRSRLPGDGFCRKWQISQKYFSQKYNVKLIEKHSKLTTEQINYDLEKDIANYSKKGEILDGNNNLVSDRGSYHSKSHLFYFKGNVEVINNDYVIRTDTMLYSSKTKVSLFQGPTTIKSEENIIYCENISYIRCHTFTTLEL